MNSRKSIIFFALLLCALLAYGLQSSPEHKLLFEKAKFTMETKGDLKQAINLFKEIIEKYPEQRQYAAKSFYYIGLCYEKLGFSDAVNAYEQVLQKYADQTEQVAAARARLAALREEKPTGFTLTKIEGPEGHFLETLALSADGTKIAGMDLSIGQNIAVFDLVTKRFELVTHLGWDNVTYYAEWSPDGKKIAYVQYGSPTSLMASTLDGKAQLLFPSKGAVPRPQDWLPDGSAVVVALSRGKDPIKLGLVPAVGGSFKALHTLQRSFGQNHHTIADASPDGKHIVFADGPERTKQNIYCIGTDGQSLEVLTDHAANDIQPRWSPDGKHVVFLSDRHGGRALWGVSVKNGKSAGGPFIIKAMQYGVQLLDWTARGLSYENWINMRDVFVMPVDPKTGVSAGKLQQIAYTPPGSNRSPVWSPDGKYLAFVSCRVDQPGVGYIVVLPAEGGQGREFLIPMDNVKLPFIMDLRWMPDSSGLGFSGYGDGKPDLHRLTLASGKWEKWPITHKGIIRLRLEWGSSGNSYLYARHGARSKEPGIVEHNLETGQEHYIYRPDKGRGMFIFWPRFSWDYKKLAFMEDNKRIVVLDMETGKSKTVSSELSGAPAWSADGQKLAVLRRVKGKPAELCVVSSEGGILKTVALEGQPKGRIYKPDWSPDGKKIALAVRMQQINLFLMKNVIPENQQ